MRNRALEGRRQVWKCLERLGSCLSGRKRSAIAAERFFTSYDCRIALHFRPLIRRQHRQRGEPREKTPANQAPSPSAANELALRGAQCNYGRDTTGCPGNQPKSLRQDCPCETPSRQGKEVEARESKPPLPQLRGPRYAWFQANTNAKYRWERFKDSGIAAAGRAQVKRAKPGGLRLDTTLDM